MRCAVACGGGDQSCLADKRSSGSLGRWMGRDGAVTARCVGRMTAAWRYGPQLGRGWVCGRVGRGLTGDGGALVALRQSKSRNLQIHVLLSGARFALIALVLVHARDTRLAAENDHPPPPPFISLQPALSTRLGNALHPASHWMRQNYPEKIVAMATPHAVLYEF